MKYGTKFCLNFLMSGKYLNRTKSRPKASKINLILFLGFLYLPIILKMEIFTAFKID